MEPEIKSCPFCGGNAVRIAMLENYFMVQCRGCGARTAPVLYGRSKKFLNPIKVKSYDEAREVAVEVWNQRVHE